MKDNNVIYFKIDAKHINYVNRVFEGYEYLGVVSTVDKKEGLLVIRATPDTVSEARNILGNLKVDVQIIND